MVGPQDVTIVLLFKQVMSLSLFLSFVPCCSDGVVMDAEGTRKGPLMEWAQALLWGWARMAQLGLGVQMMLRTSRPRAGVGRLEEEEAAAHRAASRDAASPVQTSHLGRASHGKGHPGGLQTDFTSPDQNICGPCAASGAALTSSGCTVLSPGSISRRGGFGGCAGQGHRSGFTS